MTSSVSQTFVHARKVTRQSFKTLLKDPQILAYPYLAIFFIGITFPFANDLVFNLWDKLAHASLFSLTSNTPHYLKILLGLVTFSFFYTAFITAYFTSAVSAAVWAKLEGRSTAPLYGLRVVFRKFLKVTKFALIAIFLFPLSLIAQRRKLATGTRGRLEVIGSALSMNIAQLAPVILTEDKEVLASIRTSVDTLGKAWRENLVIKAGMYGSLLLLGLIGFLPKLFEKHWFKGESAHFVGWLMTAFLWAMGYVLVRVIGGAITTNLYWHAKNKK